MWEKILADIRTSLLNLFTFGAYSKTTTTAESQDVGIAYRGALLFYLLLANTASLAKKEWDSFRKERSNADKSFDDKAKQVQHDFNAMRPELLAGEVLSSAKIATHQFGTKVVKPKHRLDSRFLNKALLDSDGCFVDVEANMSFGDLIKFLLKAGYRIPLVPEFLQMTVGGAFSGVAIESSGHKFGLFHEHVLQAEVLMPDGTLKTVSLKEYTDEFYALPNSNGTLGRVMRLRLPMIPLKSLHPDQDCHPFLDERYKQDYLKSPEPSWLVQNSINPDPAKKQSTDHVHLKYFHFRDNEKALAAFWAFSEAKKVDFVESVLLSPNNIVLIVGDVVPNVEGIPNTLRHNYITRDVFWKDVIDETCTENYVPLIDYFSRWNQSVFWNTQSEGSLTDILNSTTFRTLFGRYMGPSFLTQLGQSYELWKEHTKSPSTLPAPKIEHMVQDIGIPKNSVPEFMDWYDNEIGLYPIWLCPVSPTDQRFSTFATKSKGMYLDFGMFTMEGKPEHPNDPWYYNKLIEAKLIELGGIKGLYSDNCYTPEQFNPLYNMHVYNKMKKRMDPDNIFPHLYDKMVLAQHHKEESEAPQQSQLPFSFETYMLWFKCASISTAASLLATIYFSGSALGMGALSITTTLAAHQVSRFFSSPTVPMVENVHCSEKEALKPK